VPTKSQKKREKTEKNRGYNLKYTAPTCSNALCIAKYPDKITALNSYYNTAFAAAVGCYFGGANK
jgi:hypothetical protein